MIFQLIGKFCKITTGETADCVCVLWADEATSHTHLRVLSQTTLK